MNVPWETHFFPPWLLSPTLAPQWYSILSSDGHYAIKVVIDTLQVFAAFIAVGKWCRL